MVAALAALVAYAPSARGQANSQGTWQTLPNLMPINPVHTTLMANGKILVVSGSGNYPAQTTFTVGVWDPSNNSITTQTQNWDMFCNGMILLPDGRPFILGGNLQYDPFFGWLRTAAYDPATGKYADMEDMAHGRWYPTPTVLGDGRVMVFSGLTETGGTNSQVEIYKVGVGWSAPTTANFTPPLYPRMHLLPSGKVFYSGSGTQSRTFDPSTNTWSGVIATTLFASNRGYGSSVLLPLTPANGYKPRVMIFGGANPSTNTTEIIDLSAATPAWASGPNMSKPRIEMNATLLPNGRILTMGGSLNDEDASTASLQADLFDASSTTVTQGSAGSNAYPRLYHSQALLLPDATVWVAGGNPNRGSYEQHIEIYKPPYLYSANGSLATRPSITSINPSVIGYGTSFQVQTPDAANISSVVLMKNGSPTHAFDMEQRMVGLTFSTGSGVLNVTGPPNGNIAPPGYYMLFVLNNSGVPSIAKFVQVSKTPTDVPPAGTITSPATNVVIAPGQSVTFAGTGSAQSGSITGYSWVFRGGSPAKSSLANPGAVTFSTAGIYTAVFTVTDSAGNTDQSPETRTVNVTSSPAPSLTGVSPNTGTQGQTNLSVVLTGTNFLSNPSCSFGAGTTVNSCTYNSSTKITANINVLASATTGTRNVTVTNTDGQSATLNGSFTVQTGTAAAPTITSASPNSGVQGQTNISVVLTGANFLANPSCDFDSDQGLIVSACTYSSATKITATLSIAANAVLGGHNIVVTDTDGQSATLINGFTVNTSSGGGGSISFGSGFTAGSMVLNGNAAVTGTSLTLTTAAGTFQNASAWFPTAVNLLNFTNDFNFQLSAGSPTADGFTWTLQGNNTAALGVSGGSLGYQGIAKSVAVKFDLYDNAGEGPSSTGLYLNGATPFTPAIDLRPWGIDLHSGHVFQVHMTYDGANLAMTVTDATTAAKFSNTWAVNIPGAVGASTAFAGFTGATGGYSALQKILSWTMSSAAATGTVATPTFNPAAGTYLGTQTVTISDATSGSTIFYTLDGTQPGTSAGGSTLQYTGAITVTSTKTIKALATASGLTASATATALYTIESQVATPTFSPVAGTYTSAQTVTVSSASTGATIYYTTSGATPTSSSTLYSGPVTVGVSETLKAIATKSGFFDSNVGSAAYTINSGGTGGIAFGSGFTAGSMVLNGSSSISSTSLTITPNIGSQAGSAWFPAAVNIQSFTNDFNFQLTAGSPTADGFTWTLQGNSTAALGAPGGSLGYQGIAKSVAVKFDLYDNGGEGPSSTGLFLNGASPTVPALAMGGAGIDLHSGHVFQVHMTYDGANLAMTITDATTAAKFTNIWVVNIPGAVGGSTAFAGFTGGTGGYSALQKILTWTMSSGSVTGTVAMPTFSPLGGSYTSAQNVTISTTTFGATIYYTTNGSTPTTGSTVYSAPVSITATTTLKAFAVKSGYNNSAVATATYTIGVAPAINYSSGFTSSNLFFNGNAVLNGTRLQLTDVTQTGADSSAWFGTPVNVQKFTTDFTFQQSQPIGDGLTFAIQNVGPTALGGPGGGLGYGSDTVGNPGMPSSVAIKFDLYDNNGEGGNSTGLYTGGASPTIPAVTLGGGVDLHSAHVFSVHIVYDGATLTMTITDTSNTANTFTRSWTVNIPAAVGANTAYAGFTAGTGGATAKQEVITWTYTVN
ncbi:MAG: chitobiase/beta-hexosaminidase C-terminal domain-containing protein [Acidobacteriota bacterium]|nr:chitobiase/beta-hexosaminidase C-terminal domain-containing protein [Acidobacteriota bacterium]